MASQTQIPAALAVVVVVGGSPELVDATRQAAAVAAAARTEIAEINGAATAVATHRPFAIVMAEAVYRFDSDEFDALARDVRAELIRVEDDKQSRSKLERFLMPRLGRAHRKRG